MSDTIDMLEAVGTWLAAGATVWAVWVAIGSSRRENERAADEHAQALQIEQDKREHDRQLLTLEQSRIRDALREKTARLAHAFHQDISLASRDLIATMMCTSSTVRELAIDTARRHLVRGIDTPGPVLIARFADQLEGFSTTDSLAILNLLSNWRAFFGKNIPATELQSRSDAEVAKIAESVNARARELHGLAGEVQDLLVPYFSHIPGLILSQEETPQGVK